MFVQTRDGFTVQDVLDRLEGYILHYSAWKVGLAQNPFAVRAEVGSPEGWRFWLMASPAEAKSLTRILLRQGMMPCELTYDSARYLYIYPAESERFANGELIYHPRAI